jgi:hypothetical protein
MDTSIIVATITSVLSFLGVVVTVCVGNNITKYRIEQLEKKQDKHNNLIERTFLLEEKTVLLDERLKVATRRIAHLERKEA